MLEISKVKHDEERNAAKLASDIQKCVGKRIFDLFLIMHGPYIPELKPAINGSPVL